MTIRNHLRATVGLTKSALSIFLPASFALIFLKSCCLTDFSISADVKDVKRNVSHLELSLMTVPSRSLALQT